MEVASQATRGTVVGLLIDSAKELRRDFYTDMYDGHYAHAAGMIGMDLVLGGAPGMVGGVARGVISRAGMFGGALDFMASSAGSMGASLVDAVARYGGRNRFSFFAKGAQIGAESLAALPEKTVRFTELASNASKADVRAVLRSGELNLPAEQVDKLLYTLGNGRMDSVTLKLMNNGNIRLAAERAGYSNGYQRMSFEIDQLGRTNKVVQTAFDDANKLVPQRPGESKNNLYDVKKWNR